MEKSKKLLDNKYKSLYNNINIQILVLFGLITITCIFSDYYFKNSNLTIQATEGASVPNIENGYIIDSGLDSIYIEPHGFLDKELKPRKIDLIITPVIDFSLPIAGKFIKGKTVLPQLLKLFKPATIMASTTGGNITFTGIINKLIKVDGSIEDIKLLKDTCTTLINPEPLRKYEFWSQ